MIEFGRAQGYLIGCAYENSGVIHSSWGASSGVFRQADPPHSEMPPLVKQRVCILVYTTRSDVQSYRTIHHVHCAARPMHAGALVFVK